MFPAEIDVPPPTYLDQLATIFTRFYEAWLTASSTTADNLANRST